MESNTATLSSKRALLLQPAASETPSEPTFLEPTTPQERVLLTSYPRSGNTLVRSYLEQLSQIYTGSDCDLRRPLNQSLRDLGMKGEGTLDQSVWIIKSHFPERIGCRTFKANKCVVIVRNPLDAIASLFNMIATASHSESLSTEQLEFAKSTDLWTEFVKQEAPVWSAFLDYWLRTPPSIPTFFVRYEDLL